MPEEHGEYEQYPGIIRWIVLIAVMLGTLLEVIDTSIVNVAVPEMMGNLGATLSQIGWVSTGYIIANVIIIPLSGWLSSMLGRRMYLTASIILFTIASFLCGISSSLNQLILFRIIQGAGGAALISTAQATLIEVFPPRQLGMVQAIFGIGVMVGPTVGPTLGGWITDNYSWPWIFFVNIPVGIAAAILTWMFVRDSRRQKKPSGRWDFSGIILLAIGLGCLQTILEKGNSEDWFESSLIQWLTVFAVGGLLAFIVRELTTDNPAVNLRVLRNRGLAAGSLFAMVLGFGLYGGVFILPVYLQQLRHFTAAQSGWIIFPGGIATALIMPFVGKLVSKYPARNLVGLGATAFILSMWLLHYITMDTSTDQLFFPLVIRGAAMGFLFLPLSIASLLGLKGKDLGDGVGLYNLSRQLGGSAGIAFLSTFIDHRSAFHRAILVDNVSMYNTTALNQLHTLQAGFAAKGASAVIAHGQALAALDGSVQAQSALMSFSDAFLMIGAFFLVSMPLLLMFKKGVPAGMRGGGGAH